MDHAKRFGGTARLYGPQALEKLRRSHVCIIGLGGVGSWAAESLARAGVGTLTLVDLDDICESNINRQLHALDSTIGQQKIDALADRIAQINPECKVHLQHSFLTEKTASGIFATPYDYVFDAIDSVRNKIIIIHACRERKIPLIISGGAGGGEDPTQIRIDDLARSRNDKLLQKLRKELRMKHGFPRDTRRKFGIPCVYSTELARLPFVSEMESCGPEDKNLDKKPGFSASQNEPTENTSLKLDCESGFGTAAHVTATYALAATSRILRDLSV